MGGYYERADNGDGTYAQLVKLTGSKVSEGIADFRLNTEGTLLASAARIATTSTPNQINFNAKGIAFAWYVTNAPTSETLDLAVRFVDPISGSAQTTVVSFGTISTAGMYRFIVYPGAEKVTTGNVRSTSLPIPRSWQVMITHSAASSWTYSLSYQTIL